jgi:hypothetical protein
VGPEDYPPYCIALPSDSRLPGGGGNQVCGFYDISPAKFGQDTVNEEVVFYSQFGRQTDIYTGLDLTVNSRLPGGAFVQGGLNTGRTATDSCYASNRRFIRNFRVGGVRLQGMFDAYNIFNNTAVLAENTRYGTSWRRPTSVLDARLLKFGVQMNF